MRTLTISICSRWRLMLRYETHLIFHAGSALLVQCCRRCFWEFWTIVRHKAWAQRVEIIIIIYQICNYSRILLSVRWIVFPHELLLKIILLYLLSVFRNGQKQNYGLYMPQFDFSFHLHIDLVLCQWRFVICFAGNPWVLESLYNTISVRNTFS